ncbi:MAG: hypothetical protein II244_06000 [Clostridia bacterium]|nr:hypothetical protein [Clostridia bacterium]
MINPIYKSDDTGAFGNTFITINLDNPNHYEVSKVIFVCGCIQQTFSNPTFPLSINLSGEETARLKSTNVCYLVAYDSEGRQKTCKGTLNFPAQNGVLQNGTCC